MLLSLDGVLAAAVARDVEATGAASLSAEFSVAQSSPSTSVSVSMLSPGLDAAVPANPVVGPRQLAVEGTRGYSIVSRPVMILRDQDGNVWSSFDGPAASDSIFFGGAYQPGHDPAGANQDVRDEQSKELTPEGLAALPQVPWTSDVSIKGTLEADREWVSFTVPVGPSTGVLHLAVRPEHDDGSSSMAMVDQMYLLDARGNLCAALTGVATPTTASRQMLTVTLQSAPAGGLVVVRLVPSPNASISAPREDGGPASPPGSGGGLGALPPPPSTDFTVEIQRSDTPPMSSGDPVAASPPFIPTGANPSTAAGVDFSHFGSANATNPTNTAPNVEPDYAANTTNWSNFIGGGRVSTAPGDLESESESESEPISLGPFVSRGAAPIGPALATTTDDPAPSIDRDEHGGGDADVARLVDADGESIRRSVMNEAAARAGRLRLSHAIGDELSPVTTLKGLGGLPTLVASFPGRRGPSQAEQLAATLQIPADLAAQDEALLDATIDRRSQRDEIAKAGIATRAAGFVIALGLASGPLYPDLIAFARRRLARKRGAGSPVRLLFRRRLTRPSV